MVKLPNKMINRKINSFNASKYDKILNIAILGSAIAIFILIVAFFISLFVKSLPTIKLFGFSFITGQIWNPVSGKYGILPFIIGTFSTSLLAIIIAFPFSISLALTLGEFTSNSIYGQFLDICVDLLAAIPSVIYGFWGIFFLVPLIRKLEIKLNLVPYGVGIFTAAIILSIMIIPYLVIVIREAIKLIPSHIKEAAYALGATRYEVIKTIIFPYISSSILTGTILAFGRAIGETMAVTMVIGNTNKLPHNIFSPANTMASVIANEFTEATSSLHLSALMEIGLVLLLISLLFNLMGNWTVRRLSR